MKLFCGNLPYTVDSNGLRQLFEEFGEVTSAEVITDRFSGESKGFAFVEMADKVQAEAAIVGLNGRNIQNRQLTVNEARPRTENRGGGFGGGDDRRRSGGGGGGYRDNRGGGPRSGGYRS